MQNDYFQELTNNLQREEFTVYPAEDGLLPVEWDGCPLCRITSNGGVRYQKEDAAGEDWSRALDRATAITKATSEYMRLMESAPPLSAGSLSGDYRLLADFNSIILAGHPTKYGIQFITWEQVPDSSSLIYGHYHGPDSGIDSYITAKRDFAARSGLVPKSALFAPEQLTEIYRSIHETLESAYPITDERQKHLEQAASQIACTVPDLEIRVALSNQRERAYGMKMKM